MHNILESTAKLADALNVLEAAKFVALGYKHPHDVWHVKERKKYLALDCGGSGAFLIERDTGEIFNIKAYGVADQNKKLKANLGNVMTAEPKFIHDRRYNYLR